MGGLAPPARKEEDVGPFEVSAIAIVMVVFGVVAIFIGRPLVNSLAQLLNELRRDRKELGTEREVVAELESTVRSLEERVKRLEAGLEFVEQLREGEAEHRLTGTRPDA